MLSAPLTRLSRLAAVADPAVPCAPGARLSPGVGAPSSRLPTPGPEQFPAKEFRLPTRQSAQNSTEAPEPRGHLDP